MECERENESKWEREKRRGRQEYLWQETEERKVKKIRYSRTGKWKNKKRDKVMECGKETETRF